jgi:hypothetical protein
MRALDTCLLRTLRLRLGTFILLLPLLESHHRRLAYSATGAAHTQKAREGINDGAEPNNAFVQLFLPIAGFLTDRHSRLCCDCGPQVRPLLPFPPLDFVWIRGQLLLDIAPGFSPQLDHHLDVHLFKAQAGHFRRRTRDERGVVTRRTGFSPWICDISW